MSCSRILAYTNATLGGGVHRWDVPAAVGNMLTFFFTYLKNGLAYDSGWVTVTVTNGGTGTPSPTPTATPSATPSPTAGGCTASGNLTPNEGSYCVAAVSGGTSRVTFTSTIGSTWCDIHYTINGGAQQNLRMNVVGGGVHRYDVPAAPGKVLRFFFTYQKTSTGQADSAWVQTTLQ